MPFLLAATLAWELTLAPALEKVSPALDTPMTSTDSTLDAARGECEALQIVVSAHKSVRSLVAELPSKAPFPVTLSRVAYLNLKTPSNTAGSAGEWPDPLIPAVDEETGETRNAFPVDVPEGRRQPIFVEVCVPEDASPGLHSFEVSVRARGLHARVPIRVRVHAVTVPASSTFPVTFGLSGRSLELGHHGKKKGNESRLELVHLYAKAALRHRISLHSMSILPPVVKGTGKDLEIDFSAWDAEIAPYMDGKALASGARFTAIDLRTPPGLSPEDEAIYLRQVASHFQEKGWLDRLFAYVMDEPKPDDRPELMSRLSRLSKEPRIRRLVTTSFDESLASQVELWTPNLNCLFVRKRDGELCLSHPPRSRYTNPWWYQSCSSHGCGSGPFGKKALDDYFEGWPSYMVDAPGASARAMAWLAFVHDIRGELYFDMVHAYNKVPEGRDPWKDVWGFGGNGDGTLFYPGTPERIGGSTHAPVPSLRLKHIRDGLEDLELLRLLSERGGRQEALEIAGTIVPAPWRIEPSPERWRKARQKLFEALESKETRAPSNIPDLAPVKVQ